MDLRNRLIAVLVLVAGALLIAVCNTVAGLGDDISATGDGLADMSRDVQEKDDKE